MNKLALILLLTVLISCGSDDELTLKSSVSFTGTQIKIVNNDTFDYVNATLYINDKYKLSNVTLKAKETYTVGIMQFADKNGNRFTFDIKPLTFSISCKVGEKYGFSYSTWN